MATENEILTVNLPKKLGSALKTFIAMNSFKDFNICHRIKAFLVFQLHSAALMGYW